MNNYDNKQTKRSVFVTGMPVPAHFILLIFMVIYIGNLLSISCNSSFILFVSFLSLLCPNMLTKFNVLLLCRSAYSIWDLSFSKYLHSRRTCYISIGFLHYKTKRVGSSLPSQYELIIERKGVGGNISMFSSCPITLHTYK